MVRRQRNQHRVMLHLNRRLLRIAVPDAVGAWVRSILLTIEHLLIPIGFKNREFRAKTLWQLMGRFMQ